MAIRGKTARSGRAPRRVVFLAVPPIEEMDLVGPWAVFSSANSKTQDGRPAYELKLVSAGRQQTFAGDTGLVLKADSSCADFRGQIDTLIVPGGTGPTRPAKRELTRWLKRQAATARRVASVCTGAFLLGQAGLLDGRRATTHWKFAKELGARFPRAKVEPDRIYVRDGSVYTSAGVTAGMDLALAIVEEDLGSAVALAVAQALVLFLRRPGGQSQFSVLLSSDGNQATSFRELELWMAQNLTEDLSVERLAGRSAMSPRNFARVFARETGVTPARYVEALRLEAARRELELTSKKLDRVAQECGFSSGEVMRRALLRSLGTSPSEYRDRFHSLR